MSEILAFETDPHGARLFGPRGLAIHSADPVRYPQLAAETVESLVKTERRRRTAPGLEDAEASYFGETVPDRREPSEIELVLELQPQVRTARFRHVIVGKGEASGADEVLPAVKEQVVRGFQIVDRADLASNTTVQLDGNVQFVGDASITNALSGVDVSLRSRDPAILRQIVAHDYSFECKPRSRGPTAVASP